MVQFAPIKRLHAIFNDFRFEYNNVATQRMSTKIIIISVHNENASTNRCDQICVSTYSVVCMQEITYIKFNVHLFEIGTY